MAVAFTSLDRRWTRDLRDLHDYLWTPAWNGDEKKLRASLLRDARALDLFLHAGGRLRKNAEKLATPWSRDHQGSSLFELLDDTHGLTAATERIRKGDYRDAAIAAQSVVQSTSIGVCSAARCFEIVEEWEGHKIDFETYMGKLADVLHSKFILEPAQFRRVLSAVNEFATDWDVSASKTEQGLAARAATHDAAWCVSRSLAIRAMLGDPSKVPETDFGTILEVIVRRL
jgi:hypothetical protein